MIDTDTILGILSEADSTGRDGHPAVHLAIRLDELGATVAALSGVPDLGLFADEAFELWERVNVTETTVHRFADDHETVKAHLETTLDRIATTARADLDWLIRVSLRQPAHAAA